MVTRRNLFGRWITAEETKQLQTLRKIVTFFAIISHVQVSFALYLTHFSYNKDVYEYLVGFNVSMVQHLCEKV